MPNLSNFYFKILISWNIFSVKSTTKSRKLFFGGGADSLLFRGQALAHHFEQYHGCGC
jgi:hypothetical protein